MKATHFGECQICGRQQKLPDGVLAKHGYSVEDGSFWNVCPGAGWKPFELACDRIEAAAQELADRATSTRDAAAYDRTRNDGFWVTDYREGYRTGARRIVRGGYFWRFISVEPGTEPERMFGNVGNLAYKRENGRKGDAGFSTVEEANERHAKDLENQAVKMEQTVKWLRLRVKNWTLRELHPIPA
jgi:hypothetical protein